MPRFRPRLSPATLGALALLLGLAGGLASASASSAAQTATATKTVRYHGYRMTIPATWPVYDLAANPTVCVRFNRHAVYLGRPSSQQRCPAHGAGRTEAILVAPLAAHGAGAQGANGPALPPVHTRRAQPANGSSTQLTVPAAGVVVTATWAGDPSVVARALGIRSVSARSAGAAVQKAAHAARAHATHRAGDPVYTGLGFDACSTPSSAAMTAWGASPYRAVGIYIGGANEACAQPNLTATWVQQESAAGWVLLPIYVGLQAPRNSCGCAAMSTSASVAASQGTAAADDAINQAEAVGIAPGNPIYDDMENYSRGTTNSTAVLAFLSAWTTELHAHGYSSGVYSSASSGVTDLVNQWGSGYVEPDQIWDAEWNGQANTNSNYIPSTEWVNHQRLHQYQGGHNATYGGVRINIDGDYVDAGAASGSVLFPNGTFVQVSGEPQFYEIAGGAPLLVNNWSDVGGVQPYTVITQQEFDELNPVPVNGTFLTTQDGATWQVVGGAPMLVQNVASFPGIQPVLVDEWDVQNAGNPASHLSAVPSSGTFVTTTTGLSYRIAGGAPVAITTWAIFGAVQPSVTVDVWDLQNIWNPAARLVYRPAIGTVVEGLPSGAYWAFGPKNRYLVPPVANAVRVDDHGLRQYSAMACRVPNLAHMTLAQVKTALLKADCHLGKVHHHLLTRRRHTLRVTKQVPRAHTKHAAYYTVGITLG